MDRLPSEVHTSDGDFIQLTALPLDEPALSNLIKDSQAGANCIFLGTTRDSFAGKMTRTIIEIKSV